MADKTYPYDPDLPYVVASTVTHEVIARFDSGRHARRFAGGVTWAEVIDTTPAPRVPEDAEYITWTSGGLRYTAFRNVLDTWNYAPGKSEALEDLPGVTPETRFTVLEERRES